MISWLSGNALCSGAAGLRFKPRQVKLDKVLPRACHRCNITLNHVVVANGCVLQAAAQTNKYVVRMVKRFLRSLLQVKVANSKKTIHQQSNMNKLSDLENELTTILETIAKLNSKSDRIEEKLNKFGSKFDEFESRIDEFESRFDEFEIIF